MLFFVVFRCFFDNICLSFWYKEKYRLQKLTLSDELCKLYELCKLRDYVNFMSYVKLSELCKLYEYFMNRLRSLDII